MAPAALHQYLKFPTFFSCSPRKTCSTLLGLRNLNSEETTFFFYKRNLTGESLPTTSGAGHVNRIPRSRKTCHTYTEVVVEVFLQTSTSPVRLMDRAFGKGRPGNYKFMNKQRNKFPFMYQKSRNKQTGESGVGRPRQQSRLVAE